MNRLIATVVYVVAINLLVALFAWITGGGFDHCAVVVLIGVVAGIAAKNTVQSSEES